MAEYYIAPKSSFDATADAIREKTGSQATIEWTQDGFADAIDEIHGIPVETIAFGRISGDIVIHGTGTMVPYAFSYNSLITSVEADELSTISTRAFSSCRGITEVSIKNCTNIGEYAFYYCDSMIDVALPDDKNITVGNYAFNNCWALDGADFSNVITVGSSAFRDCWGKNCLFNPITVNDSGFRDTEYLSVEFWPRLTTINGTYTFAGAYDTSNYCAVNNFVAPALTTIANNATLSYNNCLQKIDLGNLTKIQNETFRADANLNILVLRKNGITALNNINAFTDTPFASGKAGGTLYVPQSQISAYQSATNWSTILGYANNSIRAIEGSIYETQYADGTEIPTT